MQTQAAQTSGDGKKSKGLKLEMPAIQAIETPVIPQKEISGIRADEIAIAEAVAANSVEVEEVKASNGEFVSTLKAVKKPIAEATDIERDPVTKLREEIKKALEADLWEVDKKTGTISGIYGELPPDVKPIFNERGDQLVDNVVSQIII
jgi:hypothetical protein